MLVRLASVGENSRDESADRRCRTAVRRRSACGRSASRNPYRKRASASLPPSFIMRWPMKRAASRNVTSFIRFSACSGVFVRALAHDAGLRAGRIEIDHDRRRDGALPEGVEAAAIEIGARGSGRNPCPACRSLSKDRRADRALPMVRRSFPPAARPHNSAWSRIISAGSRTRGPRASSRFSGSRCSSSGVASEDWRYVALVTISFCIALMSQPVRTNSVASQSSNSGCEGHSPWRRNPRPS